MSSLKRTHTRTWIMVAPRSAAVEYSLEGSATSASEYNESDIDVWVPQRIAR
jgi:hypothetical protein